jgi:TP53 regulating kinase-like protein
MIRTIGYGAEAIITLENNKVKKNRIEKSYRLPILDEQIRKSRTKKEARILVKAKSFGVNVPSVLNLNKKGEPKDKFDLELEYIEGEKLSQTLNDYKKEKQEKVMEMLGKQVAILHENNIIHGDLTTSNVILSENEIYIIDFGLGFISHRLEDKAVDLHLIKQALEAKHWQNNEELFSSFLEGYNWGKTKSVLEQLKKVEARGRYRH